MRIPKGKDSLINAILEKLLVGDIMVHQVPAGKDMPPDEKIMEEKNPQEKEDQGGFE
jgi:hypothetical protein